MTALTIFLFMLTLTSLSEYAQKIQESSALDEEVFNRENQHLQWVSALLQFVINENQTELNAVKDPHQCALGQWYYGESRDRAIAAFPGIAHAVADLEEPHRVLHATAGVIETLKARDGRNSLQEISQEFRDSTLPALRGVRAQLTAMRDQIDQARLMEKAAFQEHVAFSRTATIVLGLTLCSLIAGLGWALYSGILAPVGRIAQYSKDCLDGEPQALSLQRHDELGVLAGNLTELVNHLNKQLAFSDGVLAGITVPCSVFSPEDKTVFTNQYMLDLLECEGSPEDVIGLSSGEYIWGEKGRKTLSSEALHENKTVSSELDFLTRKGNTRHASVTSSPVYDRNGELLGTISTWIDLTEIMEKQRAIEESNRTTAEVAASAQEIADNVSDNSARIAAQVEQASQGAAVQRDRLGQTATAMMQMDASVSEVAHSAGDASSTALEARNKAQQGADDVLQLIRGIALVERSTVELGCGMHELETQAEGIGNIIEVISEIADQTNLLALNAAIEAARAGDAGKGFAVVADEVRKLAEKTMQATQKVGEVIKGIQHETSVNLDHAKNTLHAVEAVTACANQANDSLQAIVTLSEDTAGRIRAIATASEEQSATSNQINRTLDDINRISDDTSAAMRDAAEAVEQLARQAGTLRALIDRLH